MSHQKLILKKLKKTRKFFEVRMRGLPFNAVKDEILEFLSGINVINRENGVFLIKTFDGRSTGDAFVLLPNEDDAVQDTDYL